MNNYIVPKAWIPVNGDSTLVQVNEDQYAVALEWAQRTQPGERLPVQEVFKGYRDIGVCLELIVKGVLQGYDLDAVTMDDVTRDHLLGGGR